MASAVVLSLATTASAQAQTFTVLHNFTGYDGGEPYAGVTFDQQGRIYGTTADGGSNLEGVVYRLVHEDEGWTESPIYSFGSPQSGDGNMPLARVVFGPDGLLYGTTYQGGASNCGTVFRLQPPATSCKTALCPWRETILYSFTGGSDGGNPYYGDLSFDQAGNIYGTAYVGGNIGYGVVFKLTRSGSTWTQSVLWNFTEGNDGAFPISGVIFDSAGNLYGTTVGGGSFYRGTAYELSPTQSGWSETTLHSFDDNYGSGAGGLIWDAHGDLVGLTGGLGTAGTAYQLTPQNGTWSFAAIGGFFGNGEPPTVAAPTFDSQGNLYGPLPSGGNGEGEIFQLTPSGQRWNYIALHQFLSCSSGGGCFPTGAVTFDANGNMYGTAVGGGLGPGMVWEITP